MSALAHKTHWLYRCFDADGFLLYIGVTSDIKGRMRAHQTPPRPGWSYPNGQLHERMASFEAEEFPDRTAAFEAEALAIRAERPPLNVKHAEGRKLTPYSRTHPRPTRPHKETTYMPLEQDYTLKETAELLKVSTRWIRDRIKRGNDGKGPFVEHIRRGNRIMFTADQVDMLRAADVQAAPPVQSITTGRKRRAS